MHPEYLLNLCLILLIGALIYFLQSLPSRFLKIIILFFTVLSALIATRFAESPVTYLLAFSYIWAIINNIRLLTHRRPDAKNTAVVLNGWLTFIVWYLLMLSIEYITIDLSVITGLTIISLTVASTMLVFTVYHTFSYRIKRPNASQPTDTPSVTLALPARNETHAIQTTLEHDLKSDYEKLEIVVIDDCSQDRTPQLIRELAHEGIRFIEGLSPGENWLGKNASYKALAEEASGDYILFTGVDVHLSPESITKLMSYVVSGNYEMVSVMPQRVGFDYLANFLQTTRYFFHFMMPWEILPGQPVLSSVWVIKRETLLEAGGFDVVPGMVVPERYFAKEVAKQGKYHFLVSDHYLGITSKKKTSSQLETVTRDMYPLLYSNPIVSFIASVALVVFMLSPFVLALTAGYTISLITCCIFIVTNVVIYTRFNSSTWFIGIFNFPFIITLEAVMIQWSMFKYEFSTVNWKDRNICIPVLNPALKRQRNNPVI